MRGKLLFFFFCRYRAVGKKTRRIFTIEAIAPRAASEFCNRKLRRVVWSSSYHLSLPVSTSLFFFLCSLPLYTVRTCFTLCVTGISLVSLIIVCPFYVSEHPWSSVPWCVGWGMRGIHCAHPQPPHGNAYSLHPTPLDPIRLGMIDRTSSDGPINVNNTISRAMLRKAVAAVSRF